MLRAREADTMFRSRATLLFAAAAAALAATYAVSMEWGASAPSGAVTFERGMVAVLGAAVIATELRRQRLIGSLSFVRGERDAALAAAAVSAPAPAGDGMRELRREARERRGAEAALRATQAE